MVAKSHENGEEAFTCINVERPRSSGYSKKSSLNRFTSSVETIYSAACRGESYDGQIYTGVGKLKGRPVKVLRDTRYAGMIVDFAFIPDSMVKPDSSGSLQMVDYTLIDVLLANVYLDSTYYKADIAKWCVSAPPYNQ